MAKKLHISRQHTMEHDECCQFSEKLLGKMVDKFGGSLSCVDDNYQYSHSTGIKAMVEPAANEINVIVTFGMLTGEMAPMVEKEINKVFDKYIDET